MVRVMTDFAADLPVDFIKEHNVGVLPFYINFGEENRLADENFTPDEFYDMVRNTDDIPKTSQCTPEIIETMFRKYAEGGAAVVYASISAAASGIVNSARMTAERLKEEEGLDITVVDSHSFSMGIGKPVMEAVLMAEAGAEKEEVVNFLTETYERDRVYFVVDDLTFLKKGGRIKATTAIIGDLLDIKPILYSNDGLVEVYAKVRGSKKAISKLVDEAVEKMDNPKEGEIIVLEADAKEKAEILIKMLEKKLSPKKISTYQVGPVITSHAGVGVLGIYFKHKKK